MSHLSTTPFPLGDDRPMSRALARGALELRSFPQRIRLGPQALHECAFALDGGAGSAPRRETTIVGPLAAGRTGKHVKRAPLALETPAVRPLRMTLVPTGRGSLIPATAVHGLRARPRPHVRDVSRCACVAAPRGRWPSVALAACGRRHRSRAIPGPLCCVLPHPLSLQTRKSHDNLVGQTYENISRGFLSSLYQAPC